tara:strand:+ start:594 stop:863 length:270 start_codon:yes stop_codon:yes gene_type:complete
MNEIIKFKVGKTYYTRSFGNWDVVYKFKVVKRTKKTVWLESCHTEKPQARRVDVSLGYSEILSPLGRYAFSPLLDAKRDKPLKHDPRAV